MLRFSDGLVLRRCHDCYSSECSNGQTSEAAGSELREAYPLGTSQRRSRLRTKLDARFSILSTCIRLFAAAPFLVLHLALVQIVPPPSYVAVLQ